MENNSPGRRQRVKRCLFGKPDQKEVEKWLTETSKKQLRQSREKWSYDFELDIPVSGDVEYEAIPVNKVPSIYKSCSVGRRKGGRIAEFDPNVPSASKDEGVTDEEPSHHRPLTRSCTKLRDDNHMLHHKSLKQAKLTNYLKVRKRRSADSRNNKDAVTPVKTMKSAAPNSPFRFVESTYSEEASCGETSPRSLSASPPKSPRKRHQQQVVHSLHSQLPKLRSHAAVHN
ncbi:hypothetical protein RB195_019690 [Necator americanus]|uniref:Uncharacterized protein n=2 Tax=Necator americanus TaxID=51031 RepID=A0ABR1CHW3_NECAM|nr:Cyclin-dependent kinase inhibitor [Necator americanus]ETN72735.1 Cyclin-dependent kinase inhibitor [Necator americanus]